MAMTHQSTIFSSDKAEDPTSACVMPILEVLHNSSRIDYKAVSQTPVHPQNLVVATNRGLNSASTSPEGSHPLMNGSVTISRYNHTRVVGIEGEDCDHYGANIEIAADVASGPLQGDYSVTVEEQGGKDTINSQSRRRFGIDVKMKNGEGPWRFLAIAALCFLAGSQLRKW